MKKGQDIVAKILIKVYTVSGLTITHEYEPPPKNKLKEFIKEMVYRSNLLCREEKGLMYFDNPHITYNPDNVVGIEICSVGVSELKSAIEKAQRKAGLIRKE
ncbi:MAG TPA: hypothetical protein G4O09_03345 [Dehalococcoidia bacterium]|nr:hypothetical protein [Dehalococcoidia bacterium]